MHNCTSRRFVISLTLDPPPPLILRRAQHERPHPPLSISLSPVSLRPYPSSTERPLQNCTSRRFVISLTLDPPPPLILRRAQHERPHPSVSISLSPVSLRPQPSSIERPLQNCTSRRFVISLTLDPPPAHTSTGSARAAPPSLIDKEDKYTSRGLR